MPKFILLTTLIVILLIPVCAAAEGTLTTSSWGVIARQHDVDPYLLYAIAVLESGRPWEDNMVRPWPWTLNVNGKGLYFQTKNEAMATFKEALKKTKNIDVGICQINITYHNDKVTHLDQLFDYSTNIRVAAKILKIALNSAPGDIELGAGRYHSWRENRARQYGRRAVALAGYLEETL